MSTGAAAGLKTPRVDTARGSGAAAGDLPEPCSPSLAGPFDVMVLLISLSVRNAASRRADGPSGHRRGLDVDPNAPSRSSTACWTLEHAGRCRSQSNGVMCARRYCPKFGPAIRWLASRQGDLRWPNGPCAKPRNLDETWMMNRAHEKSKARRDQRGSARRSSQFGQARGGVRLKVGENPGERGKQALARSANRWPRR